MRFPQFLKNFGIKLIFLNDEPHLHHDLQGSLLGKLLGLSRDLEVTVHLAQVSQETLIDQQITMFLLR